MPSSPIQSFFIPNFAYFFPVAALILFQIRATISGSSSTAEQRLGLPKADWVHFAEGNATALIVHALELAKLADLVTTEKVERIERMMNSSMQQNEQIVRKGAEALERLTAEEEQKLSKRTTTTNLAERNNWRPQIWMKFCFIFIIFAY